MEYTVVKKTDLMEFIAEVNAKCLDGWMTTGNLVVDHYARLYQPMVKLSDEEKVDHVIALLGYGAVRDRWTGM